MGQDLESIGKSDINFLKLAQYYSFDTLNLRPEEKNALMKYKVEYMFLQLRATLLNFILDKVNEIYLDGGFTKPSRETDWIELMTVIHIQNKEENDRNLTSEINKYSQMTADVNRAFLLFCSTKVNYYLMYNNA